MVRRIVRVLLDKNVPYPLKNHLPDHTVSAVEDEGWDTLSNGQLLRAAEAHFDVLVTCDQNIVSQQNLTLRQIAIVVIDTNVWPVIRADPNPIARAVNAARPGGYQMVSYPKPALRRRPYPPTTG
jgi:hypothetical protein